MVDLIQGKHPCIHKIFQTAFLQIYHSWDKVGKRHILSSPKQRNNVMLKIKSVVAYHSENKQCQGKGKRRKWKFHRTVV